MGKTVREEDLIKHLNELEEAVTKGDVLAEQDPEGGLATEGKPLSSKSKETSKAMSASDASSDDESSDEGGEEEKPPVKKCKKAVADDDSSEDESDDESDDASKSFRQRADGDETMQKAIEVSDFIEATVDQIDATLKDIKKGLQQDILHAHAAQGDFNKRLAKAIVSIGTEVREMRDLKEFVKSLVNQPNVPQRKSVLSKSEIVDPPHAGDSLGDNIPREAAVRWLVSKAEKGEIDPVQVTVFEQNGYHVASLPLQLQKALVNDLAK